MGKFFRWTGMALVVMFILFAASLIWPQWLLHEHMQRGQFEIWSAEKPDPRIFDIIDSASTRIQSSELYDANARYEVFLCEDLATFSLFAPLSRDAFACTYPVVHHIFVARTDVANDQVFRPVEKHNTRTLTGVLTHETTHLMVEHGLGLWKFKSMPVWKHEGYCDHIAQESSIGREEGLAELCASTLDHAYFEGRLMVEHLLTHGATFREVAGRSLDASTLLEEVRRSRCPLSPARRSE